MQHGLEQEKVAEPQRHAPARWAKSVRTRLGTLSNQLAWVFFAGMVVTIPFREHNVWIHNPFPPIYKEYTDVLFFTSDRYLLAALAAWLFSLLLRPRRLTGGPRFIFLPLLALTGAGFLSVSFSIDALLSAYHAVRFLLLAGLYLFVVNEIRSLNRVVLPVALQAIVQAAIGIAQALNQRSLGLDSLGELALDPAWNGVSIVWAEGVRSLRAYGLSDHPNILGGCLAFALIILAAWILHANGKWLGLAAGMFALGSLGLFYTYSRSAWLAFASALLLIFGMLMITAQREAAFREINLVAAALVVCAPFVWQNAAYLGMRMNWQNSFENVPHENQAIGERQLLNQAAGQILASHPGGVGLGALTLALQREFPALPVAYQPAHFALLDAAVETGFLGALSYAFLLIAPWLALFRNRARLSWSPQLIGVSGLILALTVVGFFDYYTWLLTPGRSWQWLAWGLWSAVYTSSLGEA